MNRRTFLQLAVAVLGDIFIPFYARPDNRVYYRGEVVTHDGQELTWLN